MSHARSTETAKTRIYRAWAAKCFDWEGGFFVHCPNASVDTDAYETIENWVLKNDTGSPITGWESGEKALFMCFAAEMARTGDL